jgi:hypothetical protein
MFGNLTVGKGVDATIQAFEMPLVDQAPQMLRVQAACGEIANSCDPELSYEVEDIPFGWGDPAHV